MDALWEKVSEKRVNRKASFFMATLVVEIVDIVATLFSPGSSCTQSTRFPFGLQFPSRFDVALFRLLFTVVHSGVFLSVGIDIPSLSSPLKKNLLYHHSSSGRIPKSWFGSSSLVSS